MTSLTTEPIARMHALLAQDDIATLDAEFSAEVSKPVLHAWVMDHVMETLATETAVSKAWLERANQMTRAEVLHSRVAQVLESLTDEDKVRVLRGQPVDGPLHPAHRYLRNYLKTLTVHWCSASPLWVGLPGSALREAAQELGWNPKLLPSMCKSSMLRDGDGEDGCARWLDQVPYAYSMVACNWIGLQRIRDLPAWAKLNARKNASRNSLQAPDEGDTLAVSAKANPVDAALARCILDLSPVALNDRLLDNPAVAGVSDEMDLRLQDLVRIYQTLDLFHEFEAGLALGRIPGVEEVPRIALPAFEP